MTKQGKIIIGVCALVVILAAWYIFRKGKDESGSTGANSEPVFPLKLGKRGKEVEQLQIYLVKEHGASFGQYGVDGIWGNETDALVKKFLKRDTISQDAYIKWGLDKIKTVKFK